MTENIVNVLQEMAANSESETRALIYTEAANELNKLRVQNEALREVAKAADVYQQISHYDVNLSGKLNKALANARAKGAL